MTATDNTWFMGDFSLDSIAAHTKELTASVVHNGDVRRIVLGFAQTAISPEAALKEFRSLAKDTSLDPDRAYFDMLSHNATIGILDHPSDAVNDLRVYSHECFAGLDPAPFVSRRHWSVLGTTREEAQEDADPAFPAYAVYDEVASIDTFPGLDRVLASVPPLPVTVPGTPKKQRAVIMCVTSTIPDNNLNPGLYSVSDPFYVDTEDDDPWLADAYCQHYRLPFHYIIGHEQDDFPLEPGEVRSAVEILRSPLARVDWLQYANMQHYAARKWLQDAQTMHEGNLLGFEVRV